MSASKLNCPQCKNILVERTEFFPFCTKRCQLIDLGAWASEKYCLPATEEPEPQLVDAEDE